MEINKKILIFGGAFNPPHVGHLHILKKAVEFVKPDETLVIVDKISPWKPITDLVPYSYRLQMVNNLFSGSVDYIIYPNENNLSYTCDIINEIHEANPDYQIFMLIGQDQYEQLDKWNNYEQINQQVTVICYRRGNKPITRLDKKHIILPDAIVDFSSTETRMNPSVDNLGQKNYDYINNNHLFLQSKIKKYMSERRYQHTLRVFDTITKIAMGNNFNDAEICQAQIAALLHDIAKQYTDEQLLTIMSKQEIESFPTFHCAHGLAGSRLAEKDFGIEDQTIIEAIRNHVIYDDSALDNKIAMALFCADKLEPARTAEDIPNRAETLEECCKDLKETFKNVLKQNKEKY